MANETMTLISTVTVGAGGATNINFTSIPQTYTDLFITYSGRSTQSASLATIGIRFNGSSIAMSGKRLLGTGSAPGAFNTSGTTTLEVGLGPASTSTANSFSNTSIYIPNYAGSTNKSFSSDSVEEENSSTAYSAIYASIWPSTAAITDITLSIDLAHAQYTTASLYGILKGSGGATAS